MAALPLALGGAAEFKAREDPIAHLVRELRAVEREGSHMATIPTAKVVHAARQLLRAEAPDVTTEVTIDDYGSFTLAQLIHGLALAISRKP